METAGGSFHETERHVIAHFSGKDRLLAALWWRLHPQSSLSALDAPFEKRYHYARRSLAWSTPEWRDVAQSLPAAGKTYLVYDPTVRGDLLYARRLHDPQVIHLAWPDLTHNVPPSLKRMGILKKLVQGMIEGSMTTTQFHKVTARKNGNAGLCLPHA